VFAENPDAAGADVAAEVDGLLNKVAQGVSLAIKMEPAVGLLRIFNDLPGHQIGEREVMVELGDLYSAESRKLLLRFQVPALASLGLAKIATMEVSYVDPATLVEQTVSMPVSVNVVPGDVASGRAPNPVVVTEVRYQEAQDVKRQASEAFERHDIDSGKRLLDETKQRLTTALAEASGQAADEIRSELDEVDRLTARADSRHTSKTLRHSHHQANRKRGRGQMPDDSGSAA